MASVDEDPDAPITRADLQRMQETILEEIRMQMDRLKKEFLKGAPGGGRGARTVFLGSFVAWLILIPFPSSARDIAALHVEVTSNVGTDA